MGSEGGGGDVGRARRRCEDRKAAAEDSREGAPLTACSQLRAGGQAGDIESEEERIERGKEFVESIGPK